MRHYYKNILQSMPLNDSPRTESVCSWEDNLQKGKLFVIKYYCVSAEPNGPTHKATAATWTSGLNFFANSSSQLPNILNMLRVWVCPWPHIPKAHTISVNHQSKNRCCIVSFSWLKRQHWFFFVCVHHFAKKKSRVEVDFLQTRFRISQKEWINC